VRVTVSGGVHGNELLGIYLVKTVQNEPLKFENIDVDFLLANPKAIKECRRYIDFDLNRSFGKESLEKDSHIYEYERAKVIKERLKETDFLIDLHTTTANMGITIVLSQDDPLSNSVAKILALEYDDVRILRWFGNSEGDFINSITPSSITIEVGPVPQGVLDADLFFRTKKVLLAALRILELGEKCEESVECYDIFETVGFPRKGQELEGMIHPELAFKDYSYLHKGDPVFITFDEKEIFHEGDEGFAVFINEAAYYEKDIAFCLTKKAKI